MEGRKVEATYDSLMDRLTSDGESALTLCHILGRHQPNSPPPAPYPLRDTAELSVSPAGTGFGVHIKEMSIITPVMDPHTAYE